MNIREPVNPKFPEVYLIDINDYVLGGENGIANRQAIELVERTAYLKQEAEISTERISENEKNIDANTAAIGHLNNIVVIADNEGTLGLVTGEKEFEDRSTDGMITVLPSGKMKLIGYENLMPRIIGQTIGEFDHDLSPWELAKHRLLEPNFQLIEIALYQELCDRKYCGDANNNTALWWYKCDHLGNRTITGLWMRVIDRRGLFGRCAGANAVVRPSDDTLYDGGQAGNFIGDAARTIYASLGWTGGAYHMGPPFSQHFDTMGLSRGIDIGFTRTWMDLNSIGPSYPVAHENRPASLTANYYIAY